MTQQNSGKKITLFLVDGEPDGRKIISLAGWTGQGLIFPRNKLKEMGSGDIARQPAVYFLFGRESEESLVASAYIGEAENLFDRLTTHNNDKSKDFWYMTIAFVSSDESLTKAHVKYLESRCVEIANEAKHFGYTLKNSAGSLMPHLPQADIPVMEEFMENIGLLLGTVGYPILQKLEGKAIADHENPLFIIQNKDVTAKGTARMTNEGFIVYKGSMISGKQSAAVAERNEKLIAKLLAEGIVEKSGDGYVFARDYSFTTPSAAGDLLLGYSTNGWMTWKTADGKTLDELYRQGL
jgi:hypothetical protein